MMVRPLSGGIHSVPEPTITGLYAADETTGGFQGAGYVNGTAQGKAAFFGHVAGERAADAGR